MVRQSPFSSMVPSFVIETFSPQKSNVSANEWKTNSNVPPSS